MTSYLETEDEGASVQEADIIEEKLLSENINAPIKLDYKLKTTEERA